MLRQYSKIFRLYVGYLTNDSKIFHVFRSYNVTRRNSMYFLMMIDPVSLGLSLVSTEKIFVHIILFLDKLINSIKLHVLRKRRRNILTSQNNVIKY